MFKNAVSAKAVLYPFLMLVAMWIGYFFQNHGFFEGCWGAIIPLVPQGLKGIIFSPLLHGNFEHLFGNSVPIAALMFLLFQFYPKVAGKVFVLGWILTGFLVWLLPPFDVLNGEYVYSCIIGASGIVYVLAFFLFFGGVFKRNLILMAISLVVALSYGSLIWGVFPEEFFVLPEKTNSISWQSHLAGAVIGIIMAFVFRNIGEKRKKFIWQFPNYYSEKDDKLWQEYRENHPEDFLEMPQKKKDDVWEHLDEIRRNSR